MQNYHSENNVTEEKASRWKPVTHQFNPPGSDFYAFGYLGRLKLVMRNSRKPESYFGDDTRE